MAGRPRVNVTTAPAADAQIVDDAIEAADPLDGAPRDGSRLWLINEDGAHVEAYWRETRRLENRRWVPTAFWALWMSTIPVSFEPVGWLEA